MKVNDRILLGAIAGAAGTLAGFAVDLLSNKLGLNPTTWPTAGERLLISPKGGPATGGRALGMTADATLGMVGAMPLVLALTLTGKDKAAFKGGIYGGLTWLAFYGVGQRALAKHASTPAAAASNLMANLAYGLVASQVIVRLGDDRLFPKAAAEDDTYADADAWQQSPRIGAGGWADDNRVPRTGPH